MNSSLTRRDFLNRSALAAGALAFPSLSRALEAKPNLPLGKAEHCIFVWLGGGMAQMDTFDPKPTIGNPKEKKAGSYYPSIDTAIPGVRFCEHLPRLAKMAERLVPVRTVNHNVIDEHAAATNRMHTGRPVSGSVVYPSIGSIVAHEKGAAADGVPPYVLIGYPSATRGPGFLGPKAGYVYLTDTESGPAGLTRPPEITPERQARREALLGALRGDFANRATDPFARNYDDAIGEGFKLQGGDFMRAFDLKSEAGSLRDEYGDEFGQRCLLSRRLIQRGVRFVEVGFNLNFVNGAGWDAHNGAQKDLHGLIKRLDQGVAVLLEDLERSRLLDKTMVVIATEFGRPAHFDGGGGRGHHGKCFSCVLAGGGLKTGQAIGTTDELAMNVADESVGVPDLFATIFAGLGINPSKNLMDGERPVPITDKGTPIAKLFA